MIWKTRHRTIDLTHHGMVMGILNATPDSFSDGGKHSQGGAALGRALEMVEQGAGIIDIGGESTRPGAAEVSVKEEMNRTIPLIKSLRNETDVLISIDTSKSIVAAAAIEAGADIVNDVTGLRDEEMIPLCAESGVGICIMHMLGEPRTMQKNPSYENEGGVVAAVKSFFKERLATLTSQGIDPDCICFDPGIGFGKTLEHNLELLRHLSELQEDRPILLGVSRKSFIGVLTDEDDPKKRDAVTAAITAMTYRSGIKLHRVHDVVTNVHALRLAQALS
ncbi:MAG: dihydropteroate synthase [Akkermansiaceae bacterium]|jgi:dihydropteroate synthase